MSGKTPPPWEPYKAATTSTSIIPPNPDSLLACFKREGLVKYKVATDLNEFNSSRPGSQFDESDLSSILDRQQNDESKFMDARFYTDASFMKLANQLKNRLNHSTSPTNSNNTTPNKPVNVVGPYIPKKSSDAESSSSKLASNSTSRMSSHQESYERQIQYLEAQLQGMQEQLSIQTQVNQELKKMLVAAIGGEDMQYRLERLVNDKLRFELELTNNTKSIDKMSEQIEQISIQCDLWRSKFLASKMMADELSTWYWEISIGLKLSLKLNSALHT